MTTKICTKCKEEKPLEGFYRNKSGKDKLHSQCRECMSKYARKRREENREQYRERDRKYREEHREKRRDYRRKDYEENREQYKERNRKYREKCGEALKHQLRQRASERQRLSSALASKTGRWSEEETQSLVQLRETHTMYQCSIELGRSYGSVNSRIKALRKQGVQI